MTPMSSFLFSDIFSKNQPDVIIELADDGESGMEFLRRCPPDKNPKFILIDYKMQRMDGPTMLDALNAIPRFQQVPKVIWSTSNNEDHRDECIRKGAVTYLTKPSDAQRLEDIVKFLSDLK